MVRELSLGERMKMELIAALLHQPKVLFLDEPTIGLDVISQQTVRDFLKVYTREKRITTMLTSHYMQDIEELCERVIIIDHGKLFHDGSLQGIVDRFSTHKLITLSKRIAFPEFNYNGLAEVLEQDPRRVKLKVARADISQATAKLLSSLQPDDITIEEVPIEDIIRDLFSEKR
jgi:ABC-2 type transport system ATP-binding protein